MSDGAETRTLTKYVIGAAGAALGFLGGAWLVLAPFALGYQPSGAGWVDATGNDLWFGIGLAIISVAGFVLYSLSLLEELREKGIIEREERVPEQPSESHAPRDDARRTLRDSGELDRALESLLDAMREDARRQRRQAEERAEEHPSSRPEARREQHAGGSSRSSLPVLGASLMLIAVILFGYARRGTKRS